MCKIVPPTKTENYCNFMKKHSYNSYLTNEQYGRVLVEFFLRNRFRFLIIPYFDYTKVKQKKLFKNQFTELPNFGSHP